MVHAFGGFLTQKREEYCVVFCFSILDTYTAIVNIMEDDIQLANYSNNNCTPKLRKKRASHNTFETGSDCILHAGFTHVAIFLAQSPEYTLGVWTIIPVS